MHERRFDPKQVHRLEDPERITWLPPKDIVAMLELKPGIDVADIGAGTGYFALPIAEEIAPGTLHAVDVSPEILEFLRSKLQGAGAPRNIQMHAGEAEATGLPDGCCDLVFLATVWHEIDDVGAALREAARLLRDDGRIAILDWSPEAQRPPGPPIEHRIPQATVESQLKDAGWQVMWSELAGRFTYLVMGRKP